MTPDERETRETLGDAEARGRRIDQLLKDPTVTAVMNGLELSYYTAWKGAVTPTDREQIYSQVSAFDALREALRAVVISGERATHDLAAMEHATDQI